MTRKEALGYFPTQGLINKIFDEHEAQMKSKEKEIAMLHNLIQRQHVSQPIKMLVCERCGKDLGGGK